ncbi:MAG: hypothetical protein E7191_02410 [Erysipelotrichaceae bacterium]|nr:hypothetical protein [Erysipelotrichaceae bacterium]
MDKVQKSIIGILTMILLALLVYLTTMITNRQSDIIVGNFQAPPFEVHAEIGVPNEVDPLLNYSDIMIEGNYGFSIAGTPLLEKNELSVYFTNPKENTVWLLLRVYNALGEEIGTTGIVRPGEYVKTVRLDPNVDDESIRVKVLSYEPDTYYSLGTASATLPVITK